MCVHIDKRISYVSISEGLVALKSSWFMLAGDSGLYKAVASVTVRGVLEL